DGDRAEHDPPPRARHRATQGVDQRQPTEPQEVQGGRGADQSPVVEARDHDEREQADDEPRGLAQGDGGAGAPHAEGRERHHAHDDERAGGREQRPVDVLEEAAVDAQHQPRTSIAATLSKKIAFRIFRAIGAATSPPLPPCSTSTTTTTSGFFTGANAANQAWSWPSVAFDFPMICAVPVLPAMSSPGIRAAAPVPSFTAAQRLRRRNSHTTGESSTWPFTCPASLYRSPPSGRSMRCTMRGRQSTPPFATAAMKRATCVGVTSTGPWPMDRLTVSPSGQPRRAGRGTRPNFSPWSSIPVDAPKPKARA